MYEEYFGLQSDPFRLTPTGKHSFEHPSYRKSRSYLEYALRRREGIVMISGPPGTGKTTLIKSVSQSVAGSSVQMNVLSCDKLKARDLIELYASDLGIEFDGQSNGSILIHLGKELKRLNGKGVQPVLVLDEAQGLSISALEQARLLTNYQNNDTPLLQIVLVGQMELGKKIMRPELVQLHQRITSSTTLNYLSEPETREYFFHRLTHAGWTETPFFHDEIFRPLYLASHGIPRWVNQIGSRLLLNGYVDLKQEIGRFEIKRVLTDLFEERLLPCSIDFDSSSEADPIDLLLYDEQ